MASTIGVFIAFCVYLIAMILIGVACMGRSNSTEDYFLGGRSLSGPVAALSAQASDMSGWLLMGLPGSVYALGTGQTWIAIGLFIGTVANWLLISGRLRKYTITANNSLTLPMYFENRFHKNNKVLLAISSSVIVVFFLVYTASALASGGKLFSAVFGIDYHIALAIGTLVILVYTFMGGFLAVCETDFVQGMLMFIALILVPIFAFFMVGGDKIAENISASGVSFSSYIDLFQSNGKPISLVEIISNLAWGLGYCGMPHILVRYMAVRDKKELDKSKKIGISWCFFSLGFAIFIGIIGRAYLFPEILNGANSEKVFIRMIQKIFTEQTSLPFIGGIFLCGILAAIMSTADSQLLVTASAVSEDIFKGVIKKDAKDKTVLSISRATVVIVAILAFIIAFNPNNSIMGLVSNAWAGFGAAFGPVTVMSLFWKRTTYEGAVAGILSGALSVIVWDYIPLINGQTLGLATGLYSLIVGFAISILCIFIISLFSPAPSEEITKEFELVNQTQD